MSDKQTQCKQIVAYIREKGCITSLEAYQKLKVTQLAARITDLESAGFVFAKAAELRLEFVFGLFFVTAPTQNFLLRQFIYPLPDRIVCRRFDALLMA